MTSVSERDPLLPPIDDLENREETNTKPRGLRKRVTEKLQSEFFRRAVITLVRS